MIKGIFRIDLERLAMLFMVEASDVVMKNGSLG